MTWKKFNGEVIHAPILEEVEQAIIRETENGYHLKVCIGTDSQVKGSFTDFATVIVLLREQHGGFMYIHQEKTQQKMTIKVSRGIQQRVLAAVVCRHPFAHKVLHLLRLFRRLSQTLLVKHRIENNVY
ncbi:MAG TPA: ribonuclease H-like YkuK family protein [Pedobacter sp.]